MDNQGSREDEKDMASIEDSPMQIRLAEEITESSNFDYETETIIHLDERTQNPPVHVDQVNMAYLGRLFECCIQQVSRLESRRDEMIKELLRLQEPMLRVVKHLRGKLAETQRLLTLAQFNYMAVYEEVQEVKKKLFATARDCIQSQVMLAEHEYEVAQSAVTQVGTAGFI